jgi:hypothetical protein
VPSSSRSSGASTRSTPSGRTTRRKLRLWGRPIRSPRLFPPIVDEQYRNEASPLPFIHDDTARVVSSDSGDDLGVQQIAKLLASLGYNAIASPASLLVDLTDSKDPSDIAAVQHLADTLVDAKAFDRLVHNLSCFSAIGPDEAESVYQILGILLQQGPANQKRFDQINGVDAPLQVVVVYTSRDPKTPDEEEKLENIYHCLCDMLMPLENKEKFVKAEGIEFSTSSVLVTEEDKVLNALPNMCSMNCFIIVYSCFLPLFSCSWDAVPHRQPWPPPV